MEEETINIRKIITTIENEKKSYSIDVDELTTFYEFKKILSSAAHLIKNSFNVYHEGQEYTNDYDDNSIKQLFPGLETIYLKITINKEINQYENELISIKLNINLPCEKHKEKYKMIYCFTCNKSICRDCLTYTQEHIDHKLEEKADYLAPAQLLINNIFKNAYIYKADIRLSKYMDCLTFRSNLKDNIFNSLRQLINNLETKFNTCLEFFSSNEDLTEKNLNNNIDLLKKYCIEYFIKLKNDINYKNIIIDDEIFLTIYNKLKEINNFKTEYLEMNKQKYEKLNTLLSPFINQINAISEELKYTFELYLNKDIYDNFKNLIKDNTVDLIKKETINDLMFNNLTVQKKSVSHKSYISINSNKNKNKKNYFISPDKKLNKQIIEKNIFQKATFSPKYKAEELGAFSNLSFNTYSNLKNQKQNDISKFSLFKEGNNADFKNKMNINNNYNDILYNSQKYKNTNININKSIKVITNKNNGNKSIKEINKNIILYDNNLNNNIQKESKFIIENFDSKNQNLLQEKNKTKIVSLFNSNEEINENKIKIINENKPNYNNIENKPNIDMDMTTNNEMMNYSSESEVVRNINVKNENNKNIENEQISSNIPFSGNLISVLKNEINNNINKNELDENNNIEGENKEKTIFFDNEEIIKKKIKAEKNEYIITGQNEKKAQLNNEYKPLFLFMYPIFNTNVIIGTIEGETTGKVNIDFEQAFNKQDIQIKEFTQGGAYCNSGQYLYFTGGQEKQKGIGKIFLRISINKIDNKVKMVKMPMMNFSHWNHSMISNDKYIFVIGGYNSNKCELFNIDDLIWEKMFDLNCKERQRSMLVIYNDYLYAFMGYTQSNILDTVERININNNLNTNKWENINISNEYNLNLKFYGSGIYNHGNELFFIGGKVGKNDNDNDYKSGIYNFSFDDMKFNNCEICFNGKLNFIENKFHYCDEDIVGNFIDLNDGCLATISISSLNI